MSNITFKDCIDRLKGKKVTVIGAGISNTPLIDTLLLNGVDTTIRDKRTYEEFGPIIKDFENRGAKLHLGERYLDGIDEEVIFRTPSLMPTNPAIAHAVKQGAVLTSEMEAFFEVCPCRIIGITGCDGKTTTASIIANLLSNQGRTVHLGGNIGTPLLRKADSIKPDDIAVVELSSFQLITIHLSPHIAVVTNLMPNHLDIHADYNEYIEAKRNIYIHQKQNDKLVLNFDNGVTRGFAETAASEVIYFSRHKKNELSPQQDCGKLIANGVYVSDGEIFDSHNNATTPIMHTDEIILPGNHNIENYLAAFAAVRDIVSVDVMRETARTFRGVAHRIELIRELRGIKFYNDSIASSPSRTIAGLRSFNQKVILVAGGKDKGIAFDELGCEIVDKVKKLVLTGAAAELIKEAVINTPGYDGEPEIELCEDFTDAVINASRSAVSGDIVLLSPACTSFDRFANFEERGNLFRDIVNKLE